MLRTVAIHLRWFITISTHSAQFKLVRCLLNPCSVSPTTTFSISSPRPPAISRNRQVLGKFAVFPSAIANYAREDNKGENCDRYSNNYSEVMAIESRWGSIDRILGR